MHPYSTAHYRRELETMSALQPTSTGSLRLTHETCWGARDGYMYANDRQVPMPDVPVLRLDGEVWMSLTPMEVQSAYMPIRLARGRVGTAGLGLGYFAQRVLEKSDVEHVVVCEVRRDVLDLYARSFGAHPKLELRHANARLLQHEYFDFFYADMYRQLLTLRAIDELTTLCNANVIRRCHWWSIEQMVFEVVQARLAHCLPGWMLTRYGDFLRMFAAHPCARRAQVFGCGYEIVEYLERASISYRLSGVSYQQGSGLPACRSRVLE